MIIHQPEISIEHGELCLSARVELTKHIDNYPNYLWFKFPEDYIEHITERSDAFLTALLLPMMYLGEEIEVRETVSPKLAENIEAVQRIKMSSTPSYIK